jgi:methionine-rich copper-binding protein CopC
MVSAAWSSANVDTDRHDADDAIQSRPRKSDHGHGTARAYLGKDRLSVRGMKLIAGLAASLLTAASISPAIAHAFPDHSVPAVGGMLAQSPAEIRIWFTQKLEPSFSNIEVLDAGGTRVDQNDSKVEAQDPTLLRVSVRLLAAGTYKVVWHVVSVDTHATEGSFSFTVRG